MLLSMLIGLVGSDMCVVSPMRALPCLVSTESSKFWRNFRAYETNHILVAFMLHVTVYFFVTAKLFSFSTFNVRTTTLYRSCFRHRKDLRIECELPVVT